jgi:lipid A 3-O-deacylase
VLNILITIFSFLFLINIANAEDTKWSFIEENDYFTFFNSDADYTQGLHIKRETKDEAFSLGQRIFTPLHKKIAPPDPKERPYAGYIYFRYDIKEKLDEENEIFYSIEPGWIGPGALGKEAQCGVHKLLSQACPKGWPYQLHNELGLTLRLGVINTTYRDFFIFNGNHKNTIILEVGNISTAAHISSEVRWESKHLYYFAGPHLHLIARDITLDGNTFRDSPSVDKHHVVSELRGGIGAKYDAYAITWFIAVRSPQFSTQGSSYNFGGVEINW